MTALEGRDSTDAQHEVFEREKLFSLLLIAGEAVEHATRQVFLILTEQVHHLVLCLAAMNHQGETGFYRPFHLFLECLQLLLFKLTAPVIIQSDFANGYEIGNLWRIAICRITSLTGTFSYAMFLQYLPEFSQLILPICLHLFRMQADHRIGITRIFPAQSQDSVRGLHVNGRQEHLAYPRFPGTSESFRSILIKLFCIEMSMRIYYFEH